MTTLAPERKDHHGHDDEHEDEGHEEGKDTVGEISSSIMLDGDQVEKDADAPILSSRVVFTPKKLGLDKQAGLSKLLASRIDRGKFETKFIRDEKEDSDIAKRGVKLGALLASRSSRDRLIQMNVMKGDVKSSGSIRAAQEELKKAQTRDKLAALIGSRSNADDLQKRGVLQSESTKDQQQQRVTSARQTLGDFMASRPTPETLVKQKIIADIGDLPGADRKAKAGQLTPAAVESLASVKIVQAAAGFAHTLALDEKGVVHAFGSASNGKLGIGSEIKEDAHPIPTVIKTLQEAGAASFIESGDNHSVAIVGGVAYTWGAGIWGKLGLGNADDSLVPKPVSLGEEKVVLAACGAYHTVLLAASGRLFAFGWNKNGRVGCGKTQSMVISSPTEVKLPADTAGKPVAIQAGQDFTMVLTDKGQLVSWGAGSFGALGHGDDKDQWEPKVVAALVSKPVVQFACGANHVLALTAGGELLSWGQNKDKQLGRDDSKEKGPAAVSSVEGKSVSGLSCGKLYSAAVVGGGKVLTWGNGARGVLAHGDEASVAAPKLVEALADAKVKQVTCSQLHTVFVTVDGKLLSCGAKDGGRLGFT